MEAFGARVLPAWKEYPQQLQDTYPYRNLCLDSDDGVGIHATFDVTQTVSAISYRLWQQLSKRYDRDLLEYNKCEGALPAYNGLARKFVGKATIRIYSLDRHPIEARVYISDHTRHPTDLLIGDLFLWAAPINYTTEYVPHRCVPPISSRTYFKHVEIDKCSRLEYEDVSDEETHAIDECACCLEHEIDCCFIDSRTQYQ